MKTQRNILIAFILNLSLAVFEIFGGIFTGSVSIISDALHDFADALSIGLAYFLEKKSRKQPDEKYTYGYGRFSVLGGLITSGILVFGSVFMIANAVKRILNPIEINYNGMIVFSVIGFVVNLIATLVTRKGKSVNQKAVNLHMLEDVLGWAIILIGAIIMRFTDISIIDAIMSIGVSTFILIQAVRNMKSGFEIMLENAPDSIDIQELSSHIKEIDGVVDVHHIHLWSIDGINVYATMHVVSDNPKIKDVVKEELKEHGINHTTIEIETTSEFCDEIICYVENIGENAHHHHHHH